MLSYSMYIKISQKFPGNSKIFPGISGNEIYGNFPGFPGRDFPGINPSLLHQNLFKLYLIETCRDANGCPDPSQLMEMKDTITSISPFGNGTWAHLNLD